jgi:hypothetical protein
VAVAGDGDWDWHGDSDVVHLDVPKVAQEAIAAGVGPAQQRAEASDYDRRRDSHIRHATCIAHTDAARQSPSREETCAAPSRRAI